MHNDNANSEQGIIFALAELYGLPAETGKRLAEDVDRDGEAELGRFDSAARAEELVAELQVYGLFVTMRSCEDA